LKELLLHLKILACEVIARELYYCAARARNTVEMELFPQGLHDNSDTCRTELQQRIDAIAGNQFGAVALGYGLCNNALAGLRATHHKLVIPRAHDCITFLLGSKERYSAEFGKHPGTYWYSAGWLEHPERGGKRVEYDQKSGLARQMAFDEMVKKYGQENAEFISSIMSAWQMHYDRAVYIGYPFNAELGYDEKVKAICAEKKWAYDELPGDLTLLQALLDGEWDEDRFLVLHPGQSIKADPAGKIMIAEA
jgi:hypothetical protein